MGNAQWRHPGSCKKQNRDFLRKASQEDEAQRQIILEQIIQFAQRPVIATVTEGIETEADQSLVRDLHCDFGQGYFYDKPLEVQKFSEKYMQ